MADFDGEQGRENRQDFSHRGADGKSLLDEVLRRGRAPSGGCRSPWNVGSNDLDQTDVHALLEHVCGKAVAKRVRPELVVEAALVSRFVEAGP
jgi:hypothetical protein